MELGCFSLSLAVKDIHASKKFYERLGFSVFAGNLTQNWVIMKNGDLNIGLFQGMFDKNMITFNPGWTNAAEEMDDFTDIRKLRKSLADDGIEIVNESEEDTSGPASFMIVDPDGNPILFDQHV
jgi:predicted lactoylglutathione lyase